MESSPTPMKLEGSQHNEGDTTWEKQHKQRRERIR